MHKEMVEAELVDAPTKCVTHGQNIIVEMIGLKLSEALCSFDGCSGFDAVATTL